MAVVNKTIGGDSDFSDQTITNVQEIQLKSIVSDDDTSVSLGLGTDVGDDFIVATDALVVLGETAKRGYVGVGTAGPDRRLEVLDDTNPQLRLSHTDSAQYLDTHIKSTGDVVLYSTGRNVFLRGDSALGGTDRCYFVIQNATTTFSDSPNKGLVFSTYGLVAGLMMQGSGATMELGVNNSWAIKIDSTANTTAVKNLSADGNVTLGDAPADVHTINGTAGLAEASTISINTPLLPTTDHTATGLTAEMLAGEAITAFNLVCISAAQPGEVLHTDANAAATMPAIGIAVEGFADAATGTILLQGFVRDDTWAWTQGAILYASATIGGMTETAPAVSGDTVQAVAIALNPDVIYFNPSLTLVTVA